MPLTLNNDLKTIKVGDYVWCKYTANSGEIGTFSDFAIKTDAEVTGQLIPATSSATPNGYFKFICVGEDHLGRKKLIADRNIQHSISWDTLNSEGIVSGSGLLLSDEAIVTLSDKINKTESNIRYLKSIVFQNKPYVAYSGTGSDGYLDLFVKTLNGTQWELVGGSPVNVDMGFNHARENDLAVYNNELYVAWRDDNNGVSIRVKKYNGNSWISVDEGGLFISSRSVDNPTMVVYNNELYVFWYEWNDAGRAIKGKKYNGGSWITLNGGANIVIGENFSPRPLSAITFNNELYLFYIYDANIYNNTTLLLKVAKFDGISWTDPLNGVSLNIKTTSEATNVFAEIFNNELYIAWTENHTSENPYIVVKKFNGLNWSLVNSQVNYTNNFAGHLSLKVHNNKLYILFREKIGSYSLIFYRSFDGTTWSDNNQAISAITVNSFQNSMVSINNELYFFWIENSNLISKKLTYWFDSSKVKVTIRLLTGGIHNTDKDNEWDNIVVNSSLNNTITPGNNNVWNWGLLSWTNSTNFTKSDERVVRGQRSAGFYASSRTSTVNLNYGFRPVLLIEEIQLYKYLFQDNNKLLTLDIQNNTWKEIGEGVPTSALFNTNGIDKKELSKITKLITSHSTPIIEQGTLGSGIMFKTSVSKKNLKIKKGEVK